MGSRKPPAFPAERPTAAKAEALARKFKASKEARLSIRVEPSTRKAVRKAAVNADKTVKRFVMEALAAAGVELAPEDLEDAGEDET